MLQVNCKTKIGIKLYSKDQADYIGVDIKDSYKVQRYRH